MVLGDGGRATLPRRGAENGFTLPSSPAGHVPEIVGSSRSSLASASDHSHCAHRRWERHAVMWSWVGWCVCVVESGRRAPRGAYTQTAEPEDPQSCKQAHMQAGRLQQQEQAAARAWPMRDSIPNHRLHCVCVQAAEATRVHAEVTEGEALCVGEHALIASGLACCWFGREDGGW